VSRDYAADMRAVIDAETGEGPYVSRIVANHIVEKLVATDADLLDGWLRAHAETLIWQAINDRDRSTRSKARATAGARRFAAAVESEDVAQVARFLDVPYVIEDGSRVRLAELYAADLLFVAQGYEQRAADNAMNAAFLRALAKKVGKDRVADHYDDEALAEMWRSVGGR
jgi:hypothetical protein